MLHEAGRDGWKRNDNEPAYEYLPDLGDPDQRTLSNTDPLLATRACASAGNEPMDSLGEVDAPAIQGLDGKTHPVLCSDVAEATIPHYLIRWRDQEGTNHISRAYSGEVKEINGERYEAENFRHRFRTSMAVLLGMFGALALVVLGILLKRDSDLQ
jgi:hypothetical protein